MKSWVSIHNHDTYSLMDAIFYPKDYLQKAKQMGANAYAQTNHGTMSGCFDFYDNANKIGIKPILGQEAYFVDDKSSKDKPTHIILLAKNKKGYESLLKAQYDGSKSGFYYKPRIDWSDLKQMSGNVICSTACSGGVIAKPMMDKTYEQDKLKARILDLKDIFGDDLYFEYVALSRTEYYKPIWQALRELAKKYDIKSIISQDTHYLNKGDYKYQQIVHNIRNKVTLEEMKNDKSKGWQMDDKDLYMKSYDEIVNIMKNIFEVPFIEECLKNTIDISNKVEKYNIYPDNFVFPKVEFSEDEMKDTIKKNLLAKCDPSRLKEYQDRIKYEWGVIKGMGFLEYFYIVADIVNWAKKNNIMVGAGRGSAAGCLISYLLNITEIDSLKYGLSFERFLNPFRKTKMPDIDCDFQKSKRQQVLSYIKKYGEENVVQISAYSTFKVKSAFKDVARMFGVSAEEAGFITKGIENDDDNTAILPTTQEIVAMLYPKKEERDMEENKLKIKELTAKYEKVLHYTSNILGNIRHFTKHAAGVVITDKPFYAYMPVVQTNKEIICGIDGNTLTSKKFLKIDILGLEALDIINSVLQSVRRFDGKVLDINNLNLEDDNVLKLFRSRDVDNIFQFDTKLMRGYKKVSKWGTKVVVGLLERMQPDKFKHLVELNALNRPGPLKIKMDEDYEKRRYGNAYVVPKLLETHLKSTYGLLLYQEQLNSIFKDWLDINEGEADLLRRKVEDSNLKDIFNERNYYEHLYKKYDKNDVEEAINFIQKVGGYLFNLSHSFSYSILGYQLMYLKCYYRKYFNVACLNNEDDEDKIKTLIDDCVSHGITIKPYNLNEMSYQFEIDGNGHIIPGVKIIKGIGEKSIAEILSKKPYKNIDDFVIRAKANKNVLEILNDNGFFKNTFGANIDVEAMKRSKEKKVKAKSGDLF